MKEYTTPSVMGTSKGSFLIPAMIAGLSVASAFAAGAAASLLKGDKSVSVDMPAGLEPIYAS